MMEWICNCWLRIKLSFRPWMPWINIIKIIVTKSSSIITNPSYIMFSIVAIGLSTMGIWIVFYPDGSVDNKSLIEQLENMSVFTFCIATLGNIATEYFFDDDNTGVVGSNLDRIQTKHLAFLLWSTSLLFTFYALKNDNLIIYSLGTTIILWLFVNINRSKFRNIDEAALQNLDPNLNDFSDGLDAEIEGDGL